MRFEYYHAGLKDVPKLSVDGTVENSIHFSHWQGNHTPPEVKADTSTEIALNLVAAPDREELTKGIELVTNNHFDTDGVLSVWTVLTGERATRLREVNRRRRSRRFFGVLKRRRRARKHCHSRAGCGWR